MKQFKEQLRIAKADLDFDKILLLDPQVKLMYQHNQFGGLCLQANKMEKAQKHLNLAFEIYQNIMSFHHFHFTNLLMNIANLNAQLKNHQKAINLYKQVIELSPYNTSQQQQNVKIINFSKKLNNYEAFVDAFTNLGVLLANSDQFEEAYTILEQAISLQPNNNIAQLNLCDLLHQIGRKKEALQKTWTLIKLFYEQETGNEFIIPNNTIINKSNQNQISNVDLSIFCLKWGSKYNAKYVNILYRSIKRNTTLPFNFYCITENSNGLLSQINIVSLQQGFEGWWGKTILFDQQLYQNLGINGQCMFIDLDMVITGNIDEILNYKGQFAILNTNEIACEKSNTDGYNSSIIIWNSQIDFSQIFLLFNTYKDYIRKYLVRFDFWLEMNIENADYLQTIYPGQINDFVLKCRTHLPDNTRIVSFPREPKPDTYPAEWIQMYWN